MVDSSSSSLKINTTIEFGGEGFAEDACTSEERIEDLDSVGPTILVNCDFPFLIGGIVVRALDERTVRDA